MATEAPTQEQGSQIEPLSILTVLAGWVLSALKGATAEAKKARRRGVSVERKVWMAVIAQLWGDNPPAGVSASKAWIALRENLTNRHEHVFHDGTTLILPVKLAQNLIQEAEELEAGSDLARPTLGPLAQGIRDACAPTTKTGRRTVKNKLPGELKAGAAIITEERGQETAIFGPPRYIKALRDAAKAADIKVRNLACVVLATPDGDEQNLSPSLIAVMQDTNQKIAEKKAEEAATKGDK